jgi:lysophospholipase
MTWVIDERRAPDGASLRIGVRRAARATATAVLLQGRGDLLEQHAEVADRFAARGLDVVSLDWRGQGGSERTAAPGVSDLHSYDDLLADLALVTDAEADPQLPLVVLAHSMGGLVAALWLARGAPRVRAAALLSPLFAFRHTPPDPLVATLARTAIALGCGGSLAWGEQPADVEACTVDTSMATDDPTGFARLHAVQRAHPQLVVRGSTWRWTAATLRAMRELRRADLSHVRARVLVASSPRDPSVDPRAHAVLVERLPQATLRTYDGRHDLLYASPSTVAALWRDIEALFDGALVDGEQEPVA